MTHARPPAHVHAHTRAARPGEAGLTLIEILVSLIASLVVLAGLFAITSAGSKGFFAQSQIAELQINLRFALERIKADLHTAAFLGSPDSALDPRVCPKPANAITAFRYLDATGPVPNPSANTNIAPDELRVLGSFDTSDYFLTSMVSGGVVTLQSLNVPASPTYEEIFAPGHILALRTYDTGNLQLLEITAADAAGRTVTTSTAPRFTYSGGTCGLTGAFGEGHEATVLSYVNYYLSADTSDTNKYDLVREPLASDGVTVAAGATAVTVGEFIVDFQIEATADTAAAGSEPSIPSATADPELFDGDGAGDAAGTARTVIVTLTARSSREDPELPHIPRASPTDVIRSFDVDTAVVGAARVRTLRVEVPLTNFVVGAR